MEGRKRGDGIGQPSPNTVAALDPTKGPLTPLPKHTSTTDTNREMEDSREHISKTVNQSNLWGPLQL